MRGRSCFLKREQVVQFLEGLGPFQLGAERCLAFNKPGGERHSPGWSVRQEGLRHTALFRTCSEYGSLRSHKKPSKGFEQGRDIIILGNFKVTLIAVG